ncbi:fumarylacetoacetate hydrolase family protein [Aspergillus novoparasiticus]|uniref:Fumarylacetoacetate hydrolase family protein n=1 Tax=Aspergillus novoparasiticus TaxID=986946 RepID=A0A5N6F190_9EURO|nr:fumarylacetoacetate hydrolase family protein [Aspergillus novoparasiticus]
MSFKRLGCFAIGDRVSFGDLLSVNGGTYNVRRLTIDPFTKLQPTEHIIQVEKLLCPIERTPIIILVGLNYQSHVNETKLNVPKYPPIFVKPADALAGPFYTMAFTPTRGTICKELLEEDALDYVLGYTAGNYLSARNFQLPEASRTQFGYSKSFDQFGTIGYTITTASEIPDAEDPLLVARVNGAVKQQTSTIDMIWSVRQIISHLSWGMTLGTGTIITAGTPARVGFITKEFLKAGDVVEVDIEGVASVKNGTRYTWYSRDSRCTLLDKKIYFWLLDAAYKEENIMSKSNPLLRFGALNGLKDIHNQRPSVCL